MQILVLGIIIIVLIILLIIMMGLHYSQVALALRRPDSLYGLLLSRFMASATKKPLPPILTLPRTP